MSTTIGMQLPLQFTKNFDSKTIGRAFEGGREFQMREKIKC